MSTAYNSNTYNFDGSIKYVGWARNGFDRTGVSSNRVGMVGFSGLYHKRLMWRISSHSSSSVFADKIGKLFLEGIGITQQIASIGFES